MPTTESTLSDGYKTNDNLNAIYKKIDIQIYSLNL